MNRGKVKAPQRDWTGNSMRASKWHYASAWRRLLDQIIGSSSSSKPAAAGLMVDLIDLIVSYVDRRRIMFVVHLDLGDSHGKRYFLASFHAHNRDSKEQELYVHKQLNWTVDDLNSGVHEDGLVLVKNWLWTTVVQSTPQHDGRIVKPVFQTTVPASNLQGVLLSDGHSGLDDLNFGGVTVLGGDRIFSNVSGDRKTLESWRLVQTQNSNLLEWIQSETLVAPLETISTDWPAWWMAMADRYLVLVYVNIGAREFVIVRYDTQLQKWTSVDIPFLMVDNTNQLSVSINAVIQAVAIQVRHDQGLIIWLTEADLVTFAFQVNLDSLIRTDDWDDLPELAVDQTSSPNSSDSTQRYSYEHVIIPVKENPTLMVGVGVTLATVDNLLYVLQNQPIQDEKQDECDSAGSPSQKPQNLLSTRVFEYDLERNEWHAEDPWLKFIMRRGPIVKRTAVKWRSDTETWSAETRTCHLPFVALPFTTAPVVALCDS